MIYPYRISNLDKLETHLSDTVNNFNREKFEKTCLKNRLKRKRKKK